MSERISLRWYSAQQAYQSLLELWAWAKPLLLAGHRLVLEVRPETRSLQQNKLLHALLTDIASQLEWAGAKRSKDTWRRLVTAAWLRARGESVEVLPAIDGHGIDIVWRSTTTLSKAEINELIDFVSAWAIERGVEFREAMQWQVCPETGEIN